MAIQHLSAARQQWSAYREDAHDRGEVILDLPNAGYWHPYFPPEGKASANTKIKRIREDISTPNSGVLRTLFAADGENEWTGILVPINEVERLGIHQVIRAATTVELRRKYISWYRYIKSVHETCLKTEAVSPALAGIWHYIEVYALMLQRARTNGDEIGPLLQSLPGEQDFASLLPSQQCISLLLSYCHKSFVRLWDGPTFNRQMSQAHATTQAFFGEPMAIEDFLQGRGDSRELLEAFIKCCRADLPYVLAQDLLDNKSGKNYRSLMPGDLRAMLEENSSKSLGEKLQRFVGRLSILDRVRSRPNTAPASAPKFCLPYEGLAEEGETKWSDLHPEEQVVLLEEAGKEASIYAGLEGRRNLFYVQIIEQLTAPVLSWNYIGSAYRPEWNMAPEVMVKAAHSNYIYERGKIDQELARIDILLPKLKRATTVAAIKGIERKRSSFETGAANRRWRLALDRQRQEVLSRQQFREQKIAEFGLMDAGVKPMDLNIWLDELLQIEEEVRPYMAYVNKAFQAALPVGTTIEFNPYRHRHDGVEFDPETIQDQDKWLRGEVMKTLRSRKDYAPITQVNTFCLDFSRSMHHDLMRDLFKVVFLLVSGLEGRDTYDAIHFFGSDFREAINFTDSKGFTSRAVLAKIMSHIAVIDRGFVVFSGLGGTNISAAVEKSHAKIKDFTEQLVKERPDVRYVSSLLVLTDGQPTVGMINIPKLRTFIDGFRDGGEISIKGIYLKHPDDHSQMISQIFGPLNSVEATSFEELVTTFVQTMSLTYKQQRKDYRQSQKRKRLLGELPD